MRIVFQNSSIVIAANDVNLSIFKPLWLQKNQIFRDEEFQGPVVITPVAVQIPTQRFQFMVLPNRIQMTFPAEYPEASSDISRILGGIVQTLPHTPYTAIGLNFDYISAPEEEKSFHAWNNRLFASEFANQICHVEDDDTLFGSYFSFDTLGTRLKIDIKPIKGPATIQNLCQSWHRGQDLVAFHFNFHVGPLKPDQDVATILNTLNKWPEALSLSRQIIEKLPAE